MKNQRKHLAGAWWPLVGLLWACGGGGTPGIDGIGGEDQVPEVRADAWTDPGEETSRPDAIGDLPKEEGGDAPAQDLPPGDLPDAPGDVETPCDDEESVARGLDWLEKAEPGFALRELEQALAACSSDPRALFLAGLAETIYGAEQFLSLLSVLTGQTTGPKLSATPWTGADPEPASQNEILAAKLHRALLELRNHFERALAHLEALGERDPGARTRGIPVYLGIHPSMVLQGRFDAGDVFLTRAVASLAAGLLDVVAGQDLNTDLLTVFGSAKDMFGGSVDFPLLSRLAAYLLNEDARFLTLHPEDGPRLFEDARRRFADVGPLLDRALDRMETGDGTADEVSYRQELPAGLVLNVRHRVRWVDPDTLLEEPWYLVLGDETLEALRSCSRSIESPGEGVTLHGGVLPTLSVLLVGFSRVGLLAAFGLDEVAGIDLASLEVDEVSGLLKGILPNVLAFDWGQFFERPVGLRTWLPEVTRDLPPLENHIRAEWECPADLAADGFPQGALRMLCQATAELIDGPHFQETPWETRADGVASAFPVLAFGDPTWNSLLWVRLDAPANQVDLEGYALADQTTWNAALSRLLGGVLSLLN